MKVIKTFLACVICVSILSCGDKKTKTDNADSLVVVSPVDIKEVMGIAEIQPAEEITNLASESSGLIEEVYVKAGQAINKGQIILRLYNNIENAQIQQANSKVFTQKQVIASALANIEVLKVQLRKAKDDFVRDNALFVGKAITKKELDNSQFAIDNISKQIYAQEVSIKQQEAKIGEFSSEINLYKTTQLQKVVKAPSNGVLLSLNARKGEYLSSSKNIGDFAPEGPIIALTEIDELFAAKIKIGQKAYVKLQGENEVLATGIVVLTSPYLRKKSLFSENSANLEDRRVREVRVQLDDASKLLLGARVECWINVK